MRLGRRDMHRGRERIVRRLAHVDVIVRMHRLLGAEFAAEHLVGAVGDHLVQVHVALGAGAGLPDHERKVIVELAVDHLMRRAGDGAGTARVDQAQLAVGLGCGKLDDAEGVNDAHRHPVMADTEILPRAFGLRTPIAIGRNVDRTEAVGFAAGRFVSRCC